LLDDGRVVGRLSLLLGLDELDGVAAERLVEIGVELEAVVNIGSDGLEGIRLGNEQPYGELPGRPTSAGPLFAALRMAVSRILPSRPGVRRATVAYGHSGVLPPMSASVNA
jgi:hypothetical protein